MTEIESGVDVVFLVGREPDVQRIPAHSWILADASPVFRAMFHGSTQKHFRVHPGQEAPGSNPWSEAQIKEETGRCTIIVSDVDGRAFDILLRSVVVCTYNYILRYKFCSSQVPLQ